jgi:hypothetical protein
VNEFPKVIATGTTATGTEYRDTIFAEGEEPRRLYYSPHPRREDDRYIPEPSNEYGFGSDHFPRNY